MTGMSRLLYLYLNSVVVVVLVSAYVRSKLSASMDVGKAPRYYQCYFTSATRANGLSERGRGLGEK